MGRTRQIVFVMVMVMSALGGLAVRDYWASAGHLQSCAVTNYPWGQRHDGTDEPNHCEGDDGYDHMFGYGGPDELYGGQNSDRMRGAFGADELRDTLGNGDVDKGCFGDSSDYADVRDGDGADVISGMCRTPMAIPI